MSGPLAKMVRAKYPGAYDDLSDEQLEKAVTERYPGVYDDLVKPTTADAAPAPSQPEGSALGRFVSNAWDVVNPVAAVTGLVEAAKHPIDTGKAIYAGQMNQLEKAKQAFSEGRYSEALGHSGASLLPVLGPIAAEAGEQIGSGDVAGGLGKATGILAPFGAAKAVGKVSAAVTPTRIADALEKGAASRYAETIAPKSATIKGLRMGAKAEKIAPQLAKDGSNAAWSRSGVRQKIDAKFAEAAQALDDAADARNAGKPIETAPVVEALKAERAKLTAKPFEASKITRETVSRESPIVDASGKPIRIETQKAVPIGDDVVPQHNATQAAQLDAAIAEVEALGPVASYDALKGIRSSYDKAAQVVYNPAVTPDFLTHQGAAKGAANVTGVLRDTLAGADPATAAANAEFSLYKSARDIVTAAEELENARPKTGRRLMSQLVGSMIGTSAGGAPGAVGGYVLGPMADSFLSSGVTTKLQTAKLMTKLADAIRASDMKTVAAVKFELEGLAKQAKNAAAKTSLIQATAGPTAMPQAR